ncbi:DUF1631 domain-containing protein [Thiocystis violascens]|uniref:Thymidine phosphorylase n=1 Tax=Thiocystis violascens (strain ATCC 17096 / DSM 198 / 6111) TaxID=765911 RepID=I3YA69_THIV6|nr:DUF1631 domain-containing protein [Thiocystis violascens]AFL73887.1 Protein of unknown function (DUF1631) [Thiocystis violascens DSM 198]
MSNVIPFGAHDNSLPKEMPTAMPEDARSILATCRDRLAQGVIAVFVKHLGRANDEFLGLADRAINLEQQQICFAAMHFIANRAQPLLDRFQKIYVAAFDASVAGLGGERPRSSPRGLDELQLIDTEEFEQDLAIGKVSTRAAFNCSQQLVALDRRLAVLLRLQRIGQDENPLYPGHLFSAMLQALTEMDVDRELSLALLQSFERQTANELPGLYADLNRHLAQSGILPTIPLGAPQSLSDAPSAGQPGGSGMASGGSAEPYRGASLGQGSASYGAASANVQQDIFSQLLQAIQTANPLHAPANTGWPSAPSAGLGPSPSANVSVHQLVDALSGLQRGQADPQSMPGLGAVRIDPDRGNVLRQIRSTPMANWSHPMDAMTIDIVSMLFDAIFNDPDLSATMRAEIAKLQIPVLKVALLDKSFFSDRKHPARHLLDVIANSGIGRGEHDEPRLTQKIHAIVESVVSGFDSDIQIFATQVQKLEEFLQDEDGRAQGKATQQVAKLEHDERSEIAASRVNEAIAPRVQRSQIPRLIVAFLERHWRQVLTAIFIRAGDTGAEWAEAIRLMDELIWSVESKSGAQERDRLLALLPDLLKRLRQGLERVQLDGAWDDFFSELIRLHMAALRNDPAPDAGPSEGQALSSQPLPWPGETGMTDSVVQPPPASAQAPPEGTEDRHLRLVQALEVGAWIEFQSFRGTRNTLRLNWVSEFKRVYLFTNRQGENAMTLAATSLAEHLRKGTARLLSQNPLTDRAVAQVLEKIKPPTP